MKKILVVGDFLSGSGLTQVIFNIFSRFPKEEYKIEAVGYATDTSNFIDEKCAKEGWQFKRVIPVTKNPVEHWRWWEHFFKSHSYDIAYFNYSSSWNYLPIVYAKRYGHVQELVCHSHNSYFSHTFSNKFLMKLLVAVNNHGKNVFNKYADKKVATSKEAAEWMFGESQDVFISINGIDLQKFKFSVDYRQTIRKKLQLNTNEKLVGFVGVLQNRKNPLLALDIFAKYHKLNPNSKFLMLGKGPLKDKINEEIKRLKITDDVFQFNFIPDVYKWYSAMDALLFPSMYEGLSLVAIESQISNLQILASDSNVEEIFATDNIKKINGLNSSDWLIELKQVLAQDKDRNYFDSRLDKFSVETQAKKIKQLLS